MPPPTKGLVSRLPFLHGILPLNLSRLPADVVAGVTLAALNMPQAMGYTKIAGTPVITGLYAILLPMSLFALVGSSRHLVVGADSATAAILAAGLAGMAISGPAEYMALCGLLALMAAAFLIIARFIGLGFLADFLSRTVLVGFLTGVGLQVSFGEIGGMLGVSRGGNTPVGYLLHTFHNLDQTNFYTLAITVAVITLILGSRQISRKVPGALIAVIGAIVVSWGLNLPSHGVAVLGPVPRGLPRFGFPQLHPDFNLLTELVPTAFSIFVVILAQSAATARAYASRYREPLNENMDLLGLSLANIGAGLSGSFVVNGSPTATQMVDSAGGRSQIAQITSSCIILLVLLFLTGPLAYMPAAVLSAVVFLICVDLVDVKGLHRIYQERPWEFWVAIITTATVVLVGVEQGILLAMFLSLIIHTRHGYRPKNALIVPSSPTGWKTQPVATRHQMLPGLLIYRFSHGMYYANAGILAEEVTVLAHESQPPLVWFCIDMAAVDDIDFSAADTLRTLHASLEERNIRLVLCEVAGDVKTDLDRSGLTALVGEDMVFATAIGVIRAFQDLNPATNPAEKSSP